MLRSLAAELKAAKPTNAPQVANTSSKPEAEATKVSFAGSKEPDMQVQFFEKIIQKDQTARPKVDALYSSATVLTYKKFQFLQQIGNSCCDSSEPPKQLAEGGHPLRRMSKRCVSDVHIMSTAMSSY